MYALQTSATDFDLTGQVIWQAANIMSTWLVEDENILKDFKDKSILELGAGPGLCGLVSAHTAKQVIFTDHMEIVMDLIDTNISSCNPRPKECELFASSLDWDKID